MVVILKNDHLPLYQEEEEVNFETQLKSLLIQSRIKILTTRLLQWRIVDVTITENAQYAVKNKCQSLELLWQVFQWTQCENKEMESLPEPLSQIDTYETINTYYGKCKCCLETGYMKTLWSEYYWEGVPEIYGEMLIETFSLTWDSADDSEFICESCVLRLRDAYNFKKDVLASEQIMCDELKEYMNSGFPDECQDVEYNIEVCIKEERLDDDRLSDTEYYEVEYLEEEAEALSKAGTIKSTVVVKSDPNTPPKKTPKWPKKKKKEEVQRPYKNYSEEDMRNCLEVVQQNTMTIAEACKFFGLPRKTVAAKLRNLKNKVLETPEDLEKYVNQENHFHFVQELKKVLTYTNVVPFKIKQSKYHCAYCHSANNSFEDPDDLRLHSRTHNDEWIDSLERMLRPSFLNEILRVDIENMQCTACEVQLKKWEDMFQHLEERHQVALEQCQKRLIPFKLKRDLLSCTFCEKRCPNFSVLDSHMNAHFCNYMCADCGDTFLAESRLKHHMVTHSTGKHPCTECGKHFSLEKYMRKHLALVHKKFKAFKCIYCTERFTSDIERHAHVVEQHNEKIRISTCEFCGKTFNWRPYYLAHLRKVHSAEKKNKCGYCSKAFVSKHELKMHEQRHTGTGQHYCSFCEKNFVTLVELKSHLKRHAKDIMELKGSAVC